MRAFRVCLVAGVLASAAVGQTTDANGVILINQQQAMVGGIGPGDASGFPVTITSPGSYRLTSNLTVRDLNTTAVEIRAAHVTLDLNGFSILGPNVCPRVIGPCPSGTGYGIFAYGESATDVTVKNGSVVGMGAGGIFLYEGAIRNVAVNNNGGLGVFMQFFGSLMDSVVSRNQNGIGCNNCLVARNTIASNLGHGFMCNSSAGYSGNVFTANGTNVSSCVNLGQNACNGAACP